MKLIIKRNQADVKGFFGGHKGVSFNLWGRCEISPEEKNLIDKYKIGDYVLATYPQEIAGTTKGTTVDRQMTVSKIINGTSVETADIKTLLELEEAMKVGCVAMKELLEVMASFGGEEVYEIKKRDVSKSGEFAPRTL